MILYLGKGVCRCKLTKMEKKFTLQSKTAIITGGGSGIGESIAQTFANQDAKVYIIDQNLSAANKIAEKINKKGLSAKAYKCDVSNNKNVNKVINEISKTSAVDILINNAGIAHVGNIEVCEEKDLDRLYEVNIKGVYNCTRAIIPFMVKNKSGCIINLTSIASSVGIKDRFAYSMSKGAVLTMTYSIASDYINDNIRCNCISPARVHTPFVDGFIRKNYPGQEKQMFENLSKTQPIGRMGTPQEIADLALYLSSDEASFITGSNFPIDGGFVKLNTN